jgi:hypothetical protein
MLKLKNNANQERGIDMDLQLRDTHLRVLWVAGINYSKNSGVNPHVHDDFYQLLFVMEGEGTITINQHSFPSLAGHCYLIPQGVEHSFRFTQETTTLDFKFILEKELADVILAGNQTGPFFVTNKSEFMHLFQLSCSHLQAHPSTLLPYQIDAGFKYSLLSMMQDKSTLKISAGWQSPGSLESSPDHPGIQQLMDYLKKNLQSKVNLEDIANHMGFHPHYLIELPQTFRDHSHSIFADAAPGKVQRILTIHQSFHIRNCRNDRLKRPVFFPFILRSNRNFPLPIPGKDENSDRQGHHLRTGLHDRNPANRNKRMTHKCQAPSWLYHIQY